MHLVLNDFQLGQDMVVNSQQVRRLVCNLL